MRTTGFGLGCAFIIFLLSGCGGNTFVKKVSPDHVLTLREYQKLPGVKNFYLYAGYLAEKDTGERILPKLDGVEDLREYAGYLEKGDSFPLFLSLDNDVIGIDRPVDVTVKQRVYFMINPPDRLSRDGVAELAKFNAASIASMTASERARYWRGFMVLVSRDGARWAPAWNWQALKEAFGIKSGSYSFGTGLSEKEGLTAQLGFETVTK